MYFFAFSQQPVNIQTTVKLATLHNTTFKSKLSIQKLFIIHFAVSCSPFTQTVTLAYYTVCEAKKNVNLKYIYIYISRVNLAIKKLTALKWVCVNAVNNALN